MSNPETSRHTEKDGSLECVVRLALDVSVVPTLPAILAETGFASMKCADSALCREVLAPVISQNPWMDVADILAEEDNYLMWEGECVILIGTADRKDQGWGYSQLLHETEYLVTVTIVPAYIRNCLRDCEDTLFRAVMQGLIGRDARVLRRTWRERFHLLISGYEGWQRCRISK